MEKSIAKVVETLLRQMLVTTSALGTRGLRKITKIATKMGYLLFFNFFMQFPFMGPSYVLNLPVSVRWRRQKAAGKIRNSGGK